MKKRYLYAILLASILVLACVSSATAATMSVAASDSASTTKLQANLVCTGSNDRTQITSALNSVATSGGGTVYLSEGTFTISSINIPANVVLQGKGPASTLLRFPSTGNVNLPNSGSKLVGVKITGPAVVYITASHVTVEDVALYSKGKRWAAFCVEKLSAASTLEDIEFRSCQAIDCDTTGFMISASDYSYVIKNLRFISCRAVNCGASGQYNPWVVGFDLAERASVDGMLVDSCYASGSYESGFHFEGAPSVKNAVLRNCVSENNGLSPTAQWGAGYVVGEGTVLENCKSANNQYGFFIHTAGFRASQCVDTGSDTSFIMARYISGITLTNVGSKNAKETALTGLDQSNLKVTNMVVENCLGSTPVLAPRATNSVIDWKYGSVSSIGSGVVTTPTAVKTAVSKPTQIAPSTATIKFTSTPTVGKIYLDGVYKGVTPAKISGITLGVHRAEIRYSGYRTWVKSISVTSDFVNRISPYSYNPTLVRL